MKTYNVIGILAFAFTLTFTANAQESDGLKNQSGVYKTFANFQAKKLDLAVDVTKAKHKIKVHEFFNKFEIDVIHSDNKKYTFKKKDIYGVRDMDGNDFRFYNDQEYQIVQADLIFVYTKPTDYTVSGGKNQQVRRVTEYFFSKTGESEIQKLTLDNLKKTFPENHNMHDALDVMFKNESELVQYDRFHNTYKVVKFLKDNL